MNLLDQVSLQLYLFMQTPWSKVVFGGLFVILIIWGMGATRNHAIHYAKQGAKFGMTSFLILILIFLGLLTYIFIDKGTLAGIFSGKRPLSEIPALAQSTIGRFQFVLGASTESSSSISLPTASQIISDIEKLESSERQKLELQMCQRLLQEIPAK